MKRRAFVFSLACAPVLAGADPAAWALLRAGGHVVLMRHAATVPGIGDPEGFALATCATQRNLSEAGRADARRIGEQFRQHRIPVAAVLSSRWCRCLDTARLAFGRAEPAPMIDSMFRDEAADKQRKLGQVRAFLASKREAGNIVMVTHDVNIQALVGRYLRQGEFVLAAIEPDGGLRALATVFAGG